MSKNTSDLFPVMRPKSQDRGQCPEAKTLRSRPRPIFEVEAEARNKVMNKKYQMMIDNIQLNLHNHDLNNTLSFLSFSLTPINCPSSIIYPFAVSIVRCPAVANRLVCLFLAPGSSDADRAEMFEAKAKALRRRRRPKLWPRAHFGLEELNITVYFV